jgi:adenosylhomocysteine nucleosidase
MHILIVEDNYIKKKTICDYIVESLISEGPVEEADTLSLAARKLAQTKYDLIILDLMLPFIENGAADSRAGLELLTQIRTMSGINSSTPVLGLSAFPEEIASFRDRFDTLGVVVLAFDAEEHWKAALFRVGSDIRDRERLKTRVDFVVVCALEEERAGYDPLVSNSVDASVRGLNVRLAQLRGSPQVKGAFIRLSRMGLVATVQEVTLALSVFSAPIWFMSGVCAGFSRNAKMGQLIVASPAWEYQAGKWSTNGFEIAPLQIDIPPATRGIIDRAFNQNFGQNLEAGLPIDAARPALRSAPALAPFASGSAVIADATRLTHIEVQHRKLAGLDMEAFGFYYALHESVTPPAHFFCCKTVVDFADSNKADDLHRYGSFTSAAAGLRLAQALIEQ